MDKAKVIDKLNEAIGLELGAMLQYNQYAHVLLGTERPVWEPYWGMGCLQPSLHFP